MRSLIGSLVVMLIMLIMLIALTRLAVAAPPSGYQCNPGTPKLGEGCSCPAGFVPKRDEENIAVCKLAQKPTEAATVRSECAKVGPSVVRAFGAALTADELKKFSPIVSKAAVVRCENAPWRKEVRACFAKATTEEAAHECLEQLPPVQRGGVDADAARAQPFAVTLGKDRVELKGAIVFAQGTATLSSVSQPLIDAIAAALKANPTVRVEVQSHTETGDDDSQRLSERRAAVVQRALISAGVPAARVSAKGFGDKMPVASNGTAWGRSRNRRVEFALRPLDPNAPADRDQDGIPDATDKCPDKPENFNDNEDTDGCPDATRFVSTSIQILDQVRFKTVSAVIDPAGRALLDGIAGIMKRDTSLKLRVTGHTDNIEPDPVKLGRARARAVRDYLVKAGADANRIDLSTSGESQPIAPNGDEAGRAQNRRVEFQVL